MNRLIKAFPACALMLTLATSVSAQNGTAYGKKFKTSQSIDAASLEKTMGAKDKLEKIVINGEISEVCQAEGCWMKMKNASGKDIFVKFKDHAFLIPKDLAGHKAYVSGTAIRKTVSVEDQKHYAEDAGKSEDEIAKITEPKVELRVDATGVVIE